MGASRLVLLLLVEDLDIRLLACFTLNSRFRFVLVSCICFTGLASRMPPTCVSRRCGPSAFAFNFSVDYDAGAQIQIP